MEVVGGGHTVAGREWRGNHCAGKVRFCDDEKAVHIYSSLARPANTLETQERRSRPGLNGGQRTDEGPRWKVEKGGREGKVREMQETRRGYGRGREWREGGEER